MEDARPIWILSGRFGRATVNVTDKALVEHAHREFNILFKLGGADTAFRSENQSLALDDNSLLLFNPWVPHAKLANADAPTMVLSLIIEPEWLVRVLADRAPRIDRLFPNSRETITEEIRIHANRLGAAIPHQLMAGGGDCEDLLVDLVDSVTRQYADPALPRDIIATARPIDYRIRKALAYIHEHALENPMIDDVARQVGLSRSRFFEQFRKCVGASPQHYIDWVRMTAATRWLANTDRPLIELADELGFGAHSNFTRFFTQHIAVSPSDFRRRTISVETERQDRRPKLVASR
ncbi:MAG: AraC family transcriptional regulator [Caulobacteraceae bacterium]|nr:AraC family transcriptional regulator [Caulobacteraceae bacterium]